MLCGKEGMKNINYQDNQIYNEITERIEYLEKISQKAKSKIDTGPAGKLLIKDNHGYVSYYLRNSVKEKIGKYISKSDTAYLKQMINKSYNERVYDNVNKEIVMLRNAANKYRDSLNSIKELYSSYELETKTLVEPYVVSDEEFKNKWVEAAFEQKTSDNNSVFITNKGEHVRSKSELTIANALFMHNIPYRYEAQFVMKDGTVIHPDFTILCMSKRKVIYWEHRGMMDDIKYSNHTVKRVKDLMKNGIVLGDNLILTEETLTYPLSTYEIEEMINIYCT